MKQKRLVGYLAYILHINDCSLIACLYFSVWLIKDEKKKIVQRRKKSPGQGTGREVNEALHYREDKSTNSPLVGK